MWHIKILTHVSWFDIFQKKIHVTPNVCHRGHNVTSPGVKTNVSANMACDTSEIFVFEPLIQISRKKKHFTTNKPSYRGQSAPKWVKELWCHKVFKLNYHNTLHVTYVITSHWAETKCSVMDIVFIKEMWIVSSAGVLHLMVNHCSTPALSPATTSR